MMKELTLKDIQRQGLLILKDVHDFCQAHGIRYSMAYGTAIGAVRHQGFIPWDDDVDLFMPRPDYELFCRLYKQRPYELVAPQDGESYITFARVCDMQHTVSKIATPWCKHETGVWIDIFPVDGADDDKREFDARYEKAHSLWLRTYRERGARQKLIGDFGIRTKLKLLVKKIIYANGLLLERHLREFNTLIQQKDFKSSKYCCQMACCDNGSDEYFPSSVFNSIITVPFENYEFCLIEDFDTVLRTEYGDYMQLPPEDKRVPKLSETRFYRK